VRPDWQESAHVPFEQMSPVGHAIPHAPQLPSSFFRLTQPPLQLVRPIWQETAHAPFEHALPAGQTVPHAPQLLGSVFASTQVIPHIVRLD
jgi:hypothetical protein